MHGYPYIHYKSPFSSLQFYSKTKFQICNFLLKDGVLHPLLQKISSMRHSLLDKKILDGQFVQIEMGDTKFLEEVFGHYFNDSMKMMSTVERGISKTLPHFPLMDRFLHQLKGGSSSIGASRAQNAIVRLREILAQYDTEEKVHT
ncbi:hypothetical protein NMG60_11013474 [Bertholletia excelsa]